MRQFTCTNCNNRVSEITYGDLETHGVICPYCQHNNIQYLNTHGVVEAEAANMTTNSDDDGCFWGGILLAIIAAILYYLVWPFFMWCGSFLWGSDEPVQEPSAPSTIEEVEETEEYPTPVTKRTKTDKFRAKIDTWKEEQGQLKYAVEKFTNSRIELVYSMRKSGRGAQVTRVYAEEILELDGQTRILSQKVKTYEAAIIKGESTFRRIERRKMMKDAGVSEAELDELAKTIYELDDSLKKMADNSTVTTLEVDDIFKEVFDGSR